MSEGNIELRPEHGTSRGELHIDFTKSDSHAECLSAPATSHATGLKGKIKALEGSIADQSRQIRQLKEELQEEISSGILIVSGSNNKLEEFQKSVCSEFEGIRVGMEEMLHEQRKEVATLRQQISSLFHEKANLQQQIVEMHRHLVHLDYEVGRP